VSYAEGGDRFAGATYDPTSHYRAAAVQAFHREHGLLPPLLREVSVHQVGLLERLLLDQDLPPAIVRVERIDARRRAGFLALRAPEAGGIVRALRARGVFADSRGDVLRLGPAPYVSDDQLRQAAAALGESVRQSPHS
jgi:kynureninase